MKARIVKTGEEITLIDISSGYGTAQFYGSDGILHIRNFREGDIQLLSDKPIDWEQRRYEIARDMLASTLADTNVSIVPNESFVESIIQYADMLIKKLKEG